MRAAGILLLLLGCTVEHAGLSDAPPQSDGGADQGGVCSEGTTRACGERTTGECSTGVQTCTDGEWGACEGEVLPAEEVCDVAGLDEDCDGENNEGCTCTPGVEQRCGVESDMGLCTFGTTTCAEDGTAGPCIGAIGPVADACDGADNDCDGRIDEDDTFYTTFFRDADMDGFGVMGMTERACSAPAGFATVAGDCDDTLAVVNPGATEVCNGRDDNCSGSNNEGLPRTTYYEDTDGDGRGDPDATRTTCAVNPPRGFVRNANDCDDTRDFIFLNASERCNGLDDDCDGLSDEGLGTVYFADSDGDGYGDPATMRVECGAEPAGFVTNSLDCDDGNGAVSPDAEEVCNVVDDDCSGAVDDDGACRDCEVATYGSHNYLFCEDRRGYWSARNRCADMGGGSLYRLAIFNNMAENDAIRDRALPIQDDYNWWIGLNDSAEEGAFRWLDGSTTSLNWQTGEPNGGRSENCVEMLSSGTFNDHRCGEGRPYICESIGNIP